jgi:hypothetical protein
MTTIDVLTKRVDDLVEAIDREIAKAKHTYTARFSHDDGVEDGVDDEVDASDPSLDATDDAENGDDGNPQNNDLEDEEDDDNTNVNKLGGPVHYQQERTASFQQGNSRSDRPGPRSSSLHPSAGLATTAAVRHSRPHIFDSRVAFIKDRDGVTKPVAMQRARLEYPDDYEDYQKFHAGTSTQEQYARRQGYGNNVAKREPSLVEVEMRKGVNKEVAMQRLAQRFGFRLFDQPSHLQKRREDLLYTFQKRVDAVMDADGVDATEATRRVRKEDPRLFYALQRAG